MPAFRELKAVSARWRSLDCEGLDHVTLASEPDRIVARGVAVGARGDVPYGVYYRIDCDLGWRTRELALATSDGRGLHLVSNGEGRWAVGTGEPLPGLDGCLDLDLSGTPFTNTLPIRRLSWREGEQRELKMAFVPFDSFEPVAEAQIYRCIEPGRRFQYQAADLSFEAELSVDEDGLVTDYAQLFARVL